MNLGRLVGDAAGAVRTAYSSSATHTDMSKLSPGQRRRVFNQLMHSFNAAAPADIANRWAHLEAAQLLVQQDFALHWTSHVGMLRLALHTRDLAEAAEQVFFCPWPCRATCCSCLPLQPRSRPCQRLGDHAG